MDHIKELIKNNDLNMLTKHNISNYFVFDLIKYTLENNFSNDIVEYLLNIDNNHFFPMHFYHLALSNLCFPLLSIKYNMEMTDSDIIKIVNNFNSISKYDDDTIRKILKTNFIKDILLNEEKNSSIYFHYYNNTNLNVFKIAIEELDDGFVYSIIRKRTSFLITRSKFHIFNNTRIVNINTLLDNEVYEFISFSIDKLKYNLKLTLYLFYNLNILSEVNLRDLRKSNFTLKVENLNKYLFNRDYKINNIDALICLSEQDNFNDFVKINKSFLKKYCNEECYNYIKTYSF